MEPRATSVPKKQQRAYVLHDPTVLTSIYLSEQDLHKPNVGTPALDTPNSPALTLRLPHPQRQARSCM